MTYDTQRASGVMWPCGGAADVFVCVWVCEPCRRWHLQTLSAAAAATAATAATSATPSQEYRPRRYF